MKRLEYLRLALLNGCANNLSWIVSAFSLVQEGPQSYLENPYLYRLISSHKKFHFVTADNKTMEIEDSDTSKPLFQFKERLTVDKNWATNIKQPTECAVGNLLFNAVAILPSFGDKYPFEAGKLSVSKHEAYIAKLLTDTPKEGETRDNSKIYVDEYLKFRDNLVYLEQLATLTSWSTTRKGITRPEGIEQFKKQLLAEYAGRLNDPTVFAEYEAKLKAFDQEWLKDDPAYGTFLAGKITNISRKKMFLAIGIPERLDTKNPIVPVTETLEEGQPTEPEKYVAVMNGARFGSFSRGSETVNGGVVSKAVQRVGGTYSVDMDDCKTKLGITKIYTKDTIASLVGRYVIQKTELVLVEKIEQAQNYLGKPITVRSPAYCQAGPGDRLCKVCAGKALSQNEHGLVIPLTEVSHLILNQSLKAMHGKNLSTAEVDLTTALT